MKLQKSLIFAREITVYPDTNGPSFISQISEKVKPFDEPLCPRVKIEQKPPIG
jgi:hypothetical protein